MSIYQKIVNSELDKTAFITWANETVAKREKNGIVDCVTMWKYAQVSGLYHQVKALLSNQAPQVAAAAEAFLAYVTPSNPENLVYDDPLTVGLMTALAAGGIDVEAHKAAALLYENSWPRYASWGYSKFEEAEYDAAILDGAKQAVRESLANVYNAAQVILDHAIEIPTLDSLIAQARAQAGV